MLASRTRLKVLYTKAILAPFSRWLKLRQLQDRRKCVYDKVFLKKGARVWNDSTLKVTLSRPYTLNDLKNEHFFDHQNGSQRRHPGSRCHDEPSLLTDEYRAEVTVSPSRNDGVRPLYILYTALVYAQYTCTQCTTHVQCTCTVHTIQCTAQCTLCSTYAARTALCTCNCAYVHTYAPTAHIWGGWMAI